MIIFLSKGFSLTLKRTTIPSEVLIAVPGASVGFLDKFIEGIVGSKIDTKKSFVILAEDGYSFGDLANENLYFDITVNAITYVPTGYLPVIDSPIEINGNII